MFEFLNSSTNASKVANEEHENKRVKTKYEKEFEKVMNASSTWGTEKTTPVCNFLVNADINNCTFNSPINNLIVFGDIDISTTCTKVYSITKVPVAEQEEYLESVLTRESLRGWKKIDNLNRLNLNTDYGHTYKRSFILLRCFANILKTISDLGNDDFLNFLKSIEKYATEYVRRKDNNNS